MTPEALSDYRIFGLLISRLFSFMGVNLGNIFGALLQEYHETSHLFQVSHFLSTLRISCQTADMMGATTHTVTSPLAQGGTDNATCRPEYFKLTVKSIRHSISDFPPKRFYAGQF